MVTYYNKLAGASSRIGCKLASNYDDKSNRFYEINAEARWKFPQYRSWVLFDERKSRKAIFGVVHWRCMEVASHCTASREYMLITNFKNDVRWRSVNWFVYFIMHLFVFYFAGLAQRQSPWFVIKLFWVQIPGPAPAPARSKLMHHLLDAKHIVQESILLKTSVAGL